MGMLNDEIGQQRSLIVLISLIAVKYPGPRSHVSHENRCGADPLHTLSPRQSPARWRLPGEICCNPNSFSIYLIPDSAALHPGYVAEIQAIS
jgi:hypothetical protein